MIRAFAVLALLVAAMGVALWLTGERGSGEQDTLQERLLEGRRLFEASTIEIRNGPEAAPMRFERQGASFRMTEPLVDLASASRLDAMARAYDTATRTRVYEPEDLDGELLEQLGLDHPRGEVRIDWGDRTLHLRIGGEGPLGRAIFVAVHGAVYRAGKALWTAIQGTPDDFREHLVFRNDVGAVRRLALLRRSEDGEERLVLETHPGAPVRLVEPIDARADPSAAGVVIAAVCGMLVERFLGGNFDPGLRPLPDFEIEVEGVAGKERCLLWSQPDGTMLGFATPRDLVFGIAARQVAQLRTPITRLRSRVLIPFVPDELRRLAIVPPGHAKPIQLERGFTNTLRLVAPVRSDTDATAISELLRALRRLGAEEFVPAERVDLEAMGLTIQRAWRLEILGPVAAAPTVILLGRDEGKRTYAKRADEPHVVLVPGESAEVLRRPWVRLVRREAYRQEAPGQVFGLRLRRGDHEVLYRRGTDMQWRKDGEGEPLERVGELVGELCDLGITRVTRVVDPDRAGATQDEIEIELLRENGEVLESMTLLVQEGKGRIRTQRVPVLYEVKGFLTDLIRSWAPR